MRRFATVLIALLVTTATLAQPVLPPLVVCEDDGAPCGVATKIITPAGSTTIMGGAATITFGAGSAVNVAEDTSTVVASATAIDFETCFDVTANASVAQIAFNAAECAIAAATAATADALSTNPAPCSAGDVVTDLDADGTLTCATYCQPDGTNCDATQAELDAVAAAALPKAGGTMTGELDVPTIELVESAGDPTCAVGDFRIKANSTSNKIRMCVNGTLFDVSYGDITAFGTCTSGDCTNPSFTSGMGLNLSTLIPDQAGEGLRLPNASDCTSSIGSDTVGICVSTGSAPWQLCVKNGASGGGSWYCVPIADPGVISEVNNLETAGAEGIADNELFMGNAADAGTYITWPPGCNTVTEKVYFNGTTLACIPDSTAATSSDPDDLNCDNDGVDDNLIDDDCLSAPPGGGGGSGPLFTCHIGAPQEGASYDGCSFSFVGTDVTNVSCMTSAGDHCQIVVQINDVNIDSTGPDLFCNCGPTKTDCTVDNGTADVGDRIDVNIVNDPGNACDANWVQVIGW